MRIICQLTLLCFTVVFFQGCWAHKEMRFSLLTNQDFRVSEMRRYSVKKRKVKGKYVSNLYLNFESDGGKRENAMKNALKNTPNAVGLMDGKITYGFWSIFFLGRSYMDIEGYPLVR